MAEKSDQAGSKKMNPNRSDMSLPCFMIANQQRESVAKVIERFRVFKDEAPAAASVADDGVSVKDEEAKQKENE